MFKLGLTWEEAKQWCTGRVVRACHNSEKIITISGPEEDVHTIVDDLKNEEIFAKTVESAGFAMHTPELAKPAKKLKKVLETVSTIFFLVLILTFMAEIGNYHIKYLTGNRS